MAPREPNQSDGTADSETATLDAVAWVRGVRDSMYEETQGMSSEEFAAYVSHKAALVDAEAAARTPNRRSA